MLETALRHAAGHGVRGPRFFDALLAFTLATAGVDEFHTRNAGDFAGIPGLRVVDPLA